MHISGHCYVIIILIYHFLSSSLFCRQQDLLKKVVEVKLKRPKISPPSSSEPEGKQPNLQSQGQESNHEKKNGHCVSESNTSEKQNKVENSTKSLLGLAYASSDDDDDDDDWLIHTCISLVIYMNKTLFLFFSLRNKRSHFVVGLISYLTLGILWKVSTWYLIK